jgi:hypothetical protein
MAITADPRRSLAVGTEVDVFSRFRHGWIGGFEVAAVDDGQYSLRRRLDAEVLPRTFDADEVRIARAPTA